MEVPFYMFGVEHEDGDIYFDQIISDRENIQEHEAYYKYLSEGFAKCVYDFFSKEIPEEAVYLNHEFERLAICCGHTHGSSFGADNFSLCDLDLAVNFKYCAPYVRSQYVKVIDMVINRSGDFNCIKYENNELFIGFYKYPDIYVKTNSGKINKLPAYELGKYGFHEEYRKKKYLLP